MLPLLMMRHRRIPRSRWKDRHTASGKHWIEQAQEDMTPERFMSSMIGYHLAIEGSLCAMAMCQGTQRRVVNIGMAAKQAAVHPFGVTVAAYVESQQHKVRPPPHQPLTTLIPPHTSSPPSNSPPSPPNTTTKPCSAASASPSP